MKGSYGQLDFPSEAEGVNQLLLNTGVFGDGTDTCWKWPTCKWFDTQILIKSLLQYEA